MINFNFNLKDIDFKKIRKMDILTVFIIISLIYNLFKQEIKDKFFVEKTAAGQIVKADQFGSAIEKNVRFEYILQDMQEKYKCTYVNVNVFHNGDSTKWGFHFNKISIFFCS